MDQDGIILAGTIAAFLAAVLSITDRLLTLKDRLHSSKEHKSPAKEERAPADQPKRADRPTGKVLQVSSYLLLQEVAVIVSAGVLLNYLGLVLSFRLQSILYLDMTGTALAAFLLGPWWGAIVALISNSLVNWVLYPEPGADIIIFPWSLVNMTGGFFWGLMARGAGFRKYLRSTRGSALSHLWYLFSFGMLGACVMSVPGTFVQAALSEQTVFALNPEVATAVQGTVAALQESLQYQLQTVFGVAWGDSAGWAILNWFQN